MARNAPAKPASATAIAAAARCTACASMPLSSAASGSLDVARIARPSLEKLSTSCSVPSTATATAKVITGNCPTLRPKGNCQLAQDRLPI
ncbi:hypothetical protein D3C87_1986920 [compost metagenome]